MTIKQCIKQKGFVIECETCVHRWEEVYVHFLNPTYHMMEDCVSFDINVAKNGYKELDQLYTQFCKDEGIPRNTVTSLSITCMGDTQEDLM